MQGQVFCRDRRLKRPSLDRVKIETAIDRTPALDAPAPAHDCPEHVEYSSLDVSIFSLDVSIFIFGFSICDAPDAHSLRWSSTEQFGNLIVVAREIVYRL
jgi:hypothetical protein